MFRSIYFLSQKNQKKGTLKMNISFKKSRCNKRKKIKETQRKANVLAKKMTECFSQQAIENTARLTKFLTRESKITPLAFLVSIAYGLFGDGGKSLNLLASNMYNWFGIKITAQALSKRLKKTSTVNFFKRIFKMFLEFQLQHASKNQYGELLKVFAAVKLEDSTGFELNECLENDYKGHGGAGSKSGMKLNTCYDITKNTISHIDIASGTTSDQKFSKNIENTTKKGELLIRDLGYFDLTAIVKMIAKGVYFISRLQKGVNLYFKKNCKAIDIYDFLKKQTQNGNNVDSQVYLGEQKIPTRLIAVKVPDEVKKKRIEKFKKIRKKEPTSEYITWCEYSIFVTNIPREKFSCNIIIHIYKIRWQIELLFKSLKSILSIHIIRSKNKNSATCMIYAKLTSIMSAFLIVSNAANLCDEQQELSVDKTMKWLNNDNQLGIAVAKDELKKLYESMVIELCRLCKDKRQTKKSTYKSLEEKIMTERKSYVKIIKEDLKVA